MRMQRQWVRVCVCVGAASDVVAIKKVVRSVVVRMIAVLVLESSCRVVNLQDELFEMSIAVFL